MDCEISCWEEHGTWWIMLALRSPLERCAHSEVAQSDSFVHDRPRPSPYWFFGSFFDRFSLFRSSAVLTPLLNGKLMSPSSGFEHNEKLKCTSSKLLLRAIVKHIRRQRKKRQTSLCHGAPQGRLARLAAVKEWTAWRAPRTRDTRHATCGRLI